jgi:hypothetical protein
VGPQITAVHDLVLVLLGVDDPRHGVNAREQRIDARAVLWRDRVKVREVEDRKPAEARRGMLAHLRHAEPAEQTREVAAPVGGNPCDDLGCGGPSRAG